MAIILIDTRYIGQQIYNARKALNMGLTTTAVLLNITRNDLKRYESGRSVVPENILTQLIHVGLAMKSFKHGKGA